METELTTMEQILQDSSVSGEIILYQPNENIRMEVRIDTKLDTVWLTQQQIADLFGTKRPAITKHLANIFKSGELNQNSVSSILEHTATDGKTYKTQFYNLDAILSGDHGDRSRGLVKKKNHSTCPCGLANVLFQDSRWKLL